METGSIRTLHQYISFRGHQMTEVNIIAVLDTVTRVIFYEGVFLH